MEDPRISQLARLVISHSCNLQPGERVLIECVGAPRSIVLALMREAHRAGGIPLVTLKDDRIIREQVRLYGERDFQLLADLERYTMAKVAAFIGVRGFHNIHELSDIPAAQLNLVRRHFIRPVHLEYRNEFTRWVVFRWPTPAAAQQARMSMEAFEDFFFQACLLDYPRLEAAMEPLVRRMAAADQVHILGPGKTDVTFSIRGMPQCKYAGRHNLPDGELFTAPVKDSAHGVIAYNVPATLHGTTFTDLVFEFEQGRIVRAGGSHPQALNKILDMDAGARYLGEFAFGFNPFISEPMDDVLFDEKIWGSVHLTPGNAYKECDNGNRSALHWDLVLMQTPEMGGGQVFFDGELIRQDGRFVPRDLEGLNPENLHSIVRGDDG